MPLLKLQNLVPWRYRSRSNFIKAHANAFFRAILNTPAVRCAREARTEVHMLVCHRDTNMLLVSAKGFLRHVPDVALVIHEDGSLDENDCARLLRHLPDARLIRRRDADRELAALLPADVMAHRAAGVFLLKLFDFNHYCRGSRLIALDSDIVFRAAPEAVIEWIRHGHGSIYNQDPSETFRARVNPENRALPPNFNAGFMGFEAPIPMAEIEAAMRAMDYWGEDQTIYSWLLAARRPQPLDAQQYFVFDGKTIPDAARMIHFISPNRFTSMTYVREAAAQARRLKTGTATQA